MNKQNQEGTIFGSLLTMAAGSIDAYSYLFHNHVFAGLQTGNIILLGINFGNYNWDNCLKYSISILAFFIGTLIIRILQRVILPNEKANIRRNVILLYEIIALLIISIVSNVISNYWSTILLSFVAAAELQEFRRLNGGPFTPLMMTGNVRTLAETTFDFMILHDKIAKKRFINTAMIMITFAIGAAAIAFFKSLLNSYSIIVPAIILVFDTVILNWKTDHNILQKLEIYKHRNK